MNRTASSSPNWFLRLAVVVLLLAAAGWGVSYLLRPVALVVVAKPGVAVRGVPGTVEVKAEFANELKSEVGGRVRLSELDIGKRVHKGDVLIQIDAGDVDLEIERIKNEIVAAKRKVELGSTQRADLLNKRDFISNLERQLKAGVVSQSDFDKEQRLKQQLEQRVELDEVNLRLALETHQNGLRAREREKTKMTITSTTDGVVTAVFARVGDLIGGNSSIATIIAVGRTVEAKLSEENFAAVKLGQKASVRFLTYGAEQYNAVVTKILPSADPTTQRYTIFLDVTMPEGRVLTPGITGEVIITIAERSGNLLIPRRALVGNYIYVVAGGRLERREVVKGYESMNEVEIMKGLQAGEEVVVEQQDQYRDGERVRTQAVLK